MSKIANVTSQATAQNIRVEYNVGQLELILKLSPVAPFANFGAFLTALENTEIEVNKQTKSGMVNVLNRGRILLYAELAQSNKGMILVDAQDLGNVVMKTSIELCDGGAVPLKDGEFFEVNFFNVPDASNPTFEVYATDSPYANRRHNIYEKHYFNAGAPREVSLYGVKTIAIPANECDKLELTFENGRRVLYTREELEGIQRDGLLVRNYVQTATGTLINQVGSLILHNVAHAVSAKITTLENTNVLLVKHQDL